MSILTKVEAKSTKGRLFLAGVTIALFVGGATMVYPFLLMISGAMRSDMDETEMSVVPAYFTDDATLVRKFLETKYNYDPFLMNRFRQRRDYSFRDAYVPEKINEAAAADLRAFDAEYPFPDHWRVLGGTELYKRIRSDSYDEFLDNVITRYKGNLAALSEDLGAPLLSWGALSFQMPEWTLSRYAYEPTPLFDEYRKLLKKRPLAERGHVNLTGAFLENVIYPEYGMSDVVRYNAAHVDDLTDFESFRLPARVPDESKSKARAEWLLFVLDTCNLSFVRSDATDADFQAYLRKEYGDVASLNKYWRTNFKDFGEIKLPDDHEWISESRRMAYKKFLQSLKPESLRLVGPEYAWVNWLKHKYGTLAALNKAHGTDYENWEQCPIPLADVETQYALANTGPLRWRYAVRNFKVVFNEMFVQGRSFVNTIIYVIFALAFSLTLQPLVAYSLSRFNPPGTWKFILIFMATMAFPPMVGMIPQFLIIRKLNLLNTFFALVLPITINGYLIFLLKGFFDSLPQDLYDAALIDGASEMRMFWQITMSMSKPILAVVALNTFRMAWMAFMYPLIVCPDENMHVLAVWLHQFQRSAPTSAVFSSILVASLPTLLIFVFAQRTIMRGIAVPSEK